MTGYDPTVGRKRGKAAVGTLKLVKPTVHVDRATGVLSSDAKSAGIVAARGVCWGGARDQTDYAP
ncbi:hypothetical protein ACVINI_006440 [Rhizobium beringeri]